jgi:branched-chain amino acid transport system permease protein
MIILVVWMIRRFTVRRPGRAWEAIRQDEDVAELMGVKTLVYKLWSFVIGAAVGGAAGVIYASKVMVISPDMFKFELSILINEYRAYMLRSKMVLQVLDSSTRRCR